MVSDQKFILDMFKEAIRMGNHSVVVLHPRAKEIVIDKFGDLARKVYSLEGKFGTNEINQLLYTTIQRIGQGLATTTIA